MSIDDLFSRHRERRRTFMTKMVLTGAAVPIGGRLLSAAVTSAHAQATTTIGTSLPFTTLQTTSPFVTTTLTSSPFITTTTRNTFTTTTINPFTTFPTSFPFSTTTLMSFTSVPATNVPEPSSVALLVAGVAAAAGLRMRLEKRARGWLDRDDGPE